MPVLEHIQGICAHSSQRHLVFDLDEEIHWMHPVVDVEVTTLRQALGLEVYIQINNVCKRLERGQSEHIHAVNESYIVRRVESLFWLEELPITHLQATTPLRKRLMLGQLLGDFAHSISNPLAVIQGRLELANLRAKDATHKKLFTMLYGQVLRISSQLQSIQAISSQRGQSLTSLTLKKWLNQFFAVSHRQSPRIVLDVPPLLKVQTDENYFGLVLDNLIHRCRTVMTPNTSIELTVQELSQQIQILIEYTGTSPSLTDIQAIETAKLQQTLPHRGVGYQILCVLILVRSFEAQFSLETTDTGGRFIVHLPIQNTQKHLQSDLKLGTTLQILLIDDNIELAGALRDFLMHEGHFVQQVNSAEQAMKHLHEDWDCIILDLQLPKLSGEELFAHMKLNFPNLTSKVVCISGNPPRDPDLKRRYLNKPFTLSQLIAAIFDPQ